MSDVNAILHCVNLNIDCGINIDADANADITTYSSLMTYSKVSNDKYLAIIYNIYSKLKYTNI